MARVAERSRCAGCASPGESGERLYREGDLRGAIEVWRAADADATRAAHRRGARPSSTRACRRYIENAHRSSKREGRLAESMLDYRLALELRPDDEATLAHVQELAREVVAQRAVLRRRLSRGARARTIWPPPTQALAKLRRLDPFEPAYETEELRLQAAIDEERRARRARARAARKAQVESLVEAGRAAFGDEQLETALDLWRRALLIDPENERMQAYIARAEQQLENLEQFRAAARRRRMSPHGRSDRALRGSPPLLACARHRVRGLVAVARSGDAARRRPAPVLVYDRPASCPRPKAVRATSGQYREIPLRWDPVLIPGVAGYVVESAPGRRRAVRARARSLRDRGVLRVDRSRRRRTRRSATACTRFYRCARSPTRARVGGCVSS